TLFFSSIVLLLPRSTLFPYTTLFRSMITEVEFNFTVKDSMLTTLPAVDKVNYIRTFEDLRERIEDRVQYIEKSLANGDDYVSQMDATFQSGMKGLNDRSEQVIDEIKVLADGYKQELDTIKQNNLNEMTDKHKSSMTELEEIKSSITNINESLVTKESLPNEIDLAFQNKPYQKYSFTTLEGKRKYIGLLGTQESDHKSVLDLPPGFYEATIPSDAWTVDAPQSMN